MNNLPPALQELIVYWRDGQIRFIAIKSSGSDVEVLMEGCGSSRQRFSPQNRLFFFDTMKVAPSRTSSENRKVDMNVDSMFHLTTVEKNIKIGESQPLSLEI